VPLGRVGRREGWAGGREQAGGEKWAAQAEREG
jgi:hypothetical protein